MNEPPVSVLEVKAGTRSAKILENSKSFRVGTTTRGKRWSVGNTHSFSWRMSDGTGSNAAVVTSLQCSSTSTRRLSWVLNSVHSSKIKTLVRMDPATELKDRFRGCPTDFTTLFTARFKVSGSGGSQSRRRMGLE